MSLPLLTLTALEEGELAQVVDTRTCFEVAASAANVPIDVIPTPGALSLLWRGYNSRDPNKRQKPKEWPLTETLLLKVGLRTGSISISWEVVRNAESQAPRQTH